MAWRGFQSFASAVQGSCREDQPYHTAVYEVTYDDCNALSVDIPLRKLEIQSTHEKNKPHSRGYCSIPGNAKMSPQIVVLVTSEPLVDFY